MGSTVEELKIERVLVTFTPRDLLLLEYGTRVDSITNWGFLFGISMLISLVQDSMVINIHNPKNTYLMMFFIFIFSRLVSQ